MDAGQLWEEARRGAPVQHCRDKIAHDRTRMIARQAARYERDRPARRLRDDRA